MVVSYRFGRFLWTGFSVFLLSACGAAGPVRVASDPIKSPARVVLTKAQAQFKSGNYGLAEKHYRRAVEKEPRNVEAWLGLAASYDQLRRFDLADRAYKTIAGLTGKTANVLNNMGYSNLLRGDLQKAKTHLVTAYRKDPSNPRILNNIELLNTMLEERGLDPIELYPA